MQSARVLTRRELLFPGAGSARKSSVVDVNDTCLAASGVTCGVCAEHCEHGALRVRVTGRPIEIRAERCVACGACIDVCPVRALSL